MSRNSQAVLRNSRDSIVNRYASGESIEALAQAYGTSPTTMRSFLLSQGVTLRPRAWRQMRRASGAGSVEDSDESLV